MKTASLIFTALMLTAACAFAQTLTIPPLPPFHFNFQVRYTGSKARPELAAFVYKSLRGLPGIGIVDSDPDAVLIISEHLNANVYACSFVILTPQTKLETDAKQVRPMYVYEGSLASVDPSAKAALLFAIKNLDVNFIEKQRRRYDYMVAHPPEPFTWSPDSTPIPKP